ncbi:MAG TPA: hemerythrin domain-containing protein [Longimicrobiales bacterium]|nr:hemerythrin domain-containing protein [Longimicrobiales bacterium]
MRITHAFLGEHGVFYAQLAELERAARDEDLAGLQRRAALLASALASHARLEDELLFDFLEAGPGAEHPILRMMREEHDEIETALRAVQQVRDAARARELLLEMIRTARDHFEKEERVVFPLAEDALSEAEQHRLGERWAGARGVRLAEAAARP